MAPGQVRFDISPEAIQEFQVNRNSFHGGVRLHRRHGGQHHDQERHEPISWQRLSLLPLATDFGARPLRFQPHGRNPSLSKSSPASPWAAPSSKTSSSSSPTMNVRRTTTPVSALTPTTHLLQPTTRPGCAACPTRRPSGRKCATDFRQSAQRSDHERHELSDDLQNPAGE